MNKTTLLLILLVALPLTDARTAQTESTPGFIRLLPDYQNQKQQGIDSDVGRIWKEDGVEIHYDIGKMAGNYADCKTCGWAGDELWRKKQTINGQESILVFTRFKRLIVTFPKSNANFYATIRTEEDMVDMLLMLCTFQPRRL